MSPTCDTLEESRRGHLRRFVVASCSAINVTMCMATAPGLLPRRTSTKQQLAMACQRQWTAPPRTEKPTSLRVRTTREVGMPARA